MALPRLLILFTGGTLAMDPATLMPAHSAREILSLVPELEAVGELVPVQLFNLDSAEMQPEDWLAIAAEIEARYEDFDGFVVVHGTDTMTYTACALSFLIQNLGKPVVLTGSQLPLSSVLGSDARNNLIRAVRFAAMDFAEVAIFFGTRLLRGNRSRKFSGEDIEAFHSFREEPLGTAGLELRLHRDRRRRHGGRPAFFRRIDPRVFLVKAFPGLEPEILETLASRGLRGLVLEAYGTGNLPVQRRSLLSPIASLARQGIPVVVVTQCERGSVEERYPSAAALARAGAILAHDITPEAALVKLMWLLAEESGLENVRRRMLENVAGELGEHPVRN